MSDPVVFDDFIDDDLIAELCGFLDPLCKPSPRFGISGTLGYPTSAVAAAVGKTVRAINGYENTPSEVTVTKLENLYSYIQETLEKFYDVDMDLVNCNYQILTPGAENPLHSDSTKLDGSPWRDDGIPEELEYSALLYLNTHGVDYSGGELYFPNQDALIQPKKGQLVFFKGDVEHIHEVRKVKSGIRKNFVFFFGRRGVASSGISYFEE